MSAALRKLWWFVRQASGDAAYENYLRSAGGGPPGRRTSASGSCDDRGAAAVQSEEEFYLDALRRRYTGVSRCC